MVLVISFLHSQWSCYCRPLCVVIFARHKARSLRLLGMWLIARLDVWYAFLFLFMAAVGFTSLFCKSIST